MNTKLTGKRRYRVSDDGLVILQVQECESFRTRFGWLPHPEATPEWRDARIEDLSEHEA